MATAKQQQDLNKQLDYTRDAVKEIEKLLSLQDIKQNTILGTARNITKEMGVQLQLDMEDGKAKAKSAKTTRYIAEAGRDFANNLTDIIKGEKQAADHSILMAEAKKEGNEANIQAIKDLQKINNIAKRNATAYQHGASAVDGIADKVKKSTGGFFNIDKAASGLKDNMMKVATGKGSIKTLFKGAKLLKVGLAGAALAAASFALEANKLQRDLGVAFGESAKILATSKSIALANKANGMTQEDTLAIMKNIASEFGSFSNATAATTLKASNLVANFGLATDSVGTLARQMQAVGADSLDSALNSIELQANMARAADVPVADVMNDVAKNTEFFAKFAKDGGANVTAAAIAAKKLGLELSNVASIADSLLNFEDSISKQMEAEVLLGKELNLEKAREMVFNNDIAGAMQEISQLVSPEEFEAMDAVRRGALAAAVGLDAGAMAKAISGGGGARGGITPAMRTGGAPAGGGGTDKMDALIGAVNEGNANTVREIQRQGQG
jgi:hypothetical protein